MRPCLALVFLASLVIPSSAQQPKYPNYPSETPQTLVTAQTGWDYTKSDVMIPMRDGVILLADRSRRGRGGT